MTARLSARGLNLRFHFHAACGVGSAAKGVDVGQFAFRRNLENGAIADTGAGTEGRCPLARRSCITWTAFPGVWAVKLCLGTSRQVYKEKQANSGSHQ
jgi:hypothetical protein